MLRRLLRALLHLLPEELAVRIVQFWRLRRYWLSVLKYKFSASRSVIRYLSDDSVYWVDPRKIIFAMNSEGFYQTTPPPENQVNWEFRVSEYHGRVMGGDWDTLKRKFSELDFYRSYAERALRGTSWEQLPYYQRVLRQINNGTEKWGCKSKQDLDERCRKLDIIFNDIKQNGYKSRRLQRKEKGKDSLFDEVDEIGVNIGRHGDLIFNNGRHRLTFAKILGIELVPVRITVRHSGWEEFVKEIEQYIQKNDGRVHAPLTHIGLQHITAHHDDEKFEMIRRSIGEGNSTLLDTKARWGYFCHRFEESGFQCTAVENDPENRYFLQKLRRAENKEFTVIPESIFTFCDRGPLQYDIVLALDIFHDLLNEEVCLEDWTRLLNSLDMNEMYLGLNADTGMQREGARVSLSPEEVVNLALDNSCLNSCQLLGKDEEGKALYKLWR